MIAVKDLKAGDVVYECERGVNMRLQVISDAARVEGREGQADGWEAVAGVADHTVTLFAGDGFEAYAPRLYREPQYREREPEEEIEDPYLRPVRDEGNTIIGWE